MSPATAWLLTRRGLRSSWGAAAVLGVVALLAALVLTTMPRAVEKWHTAMLVHEADKVSALSRDVSMTPLGAPPSFATWEPGVVAAPPWDGVLRSLDELRAKQRQPLREVLTAPELVVSGPEVPVAHGPGVDVSHVELVPRSAPDLADHARLVEGSWPRPGEFGLWWGEGSSLPPLIAPGKKPSDIEPTQIVLSRAAAAAIGWTVGSVYEAPLPLPPFELVGLYEPIDPDDGYWEHAAFGAAPRIVRDPLSGATATVAASVAPEMITPLVQEDPRVAAWYPVDLSRVSGADTPGLLVRMRAFTSATYAANGLGDMRLRATSGSTGVLERVLAQRAGVDSVLAVMAAGPVGAMLVVLALGARLVVERRRPALVLLRARGAAGRQVRAVAAAEGAAVGVPGAAVGTAIGLVLAPGSFDVGQAVLALVAGLAPAVALAVTASVGSLRSERTDLGRSARWRTVGELLVLLAAGVTTALLVTRGAVGAGGTSGGVAHPGTVDPLVTVAPALLCLAVALLVVRGMPWLVAPLERALAGRRGLVGFLGAARARRDPAGGVLPAVALVLCLAVAASSSVLRTTVDAGITGATWEKVGADVRVEDVWVSPEQVKTLRASDDVAAVATLADLGRAELRTGNGAPLQVLVLAVDAAELARVQDGVPGAPPAADLAALTAGGEGALSMLVSTSTGLGQGATGDLEREGSTKTPTSVRAAGTLGTLPGMPPAERFVLVDSAKAAEVFDTDVMPGLAFVRLRSVGDGEPRATTVHIPAAVRAVFPAQGAHLESVGEAAVALRGSPATRALGAAAALALVLAALLSALTVALTLLLAGPARARLLAVLRSLGGGPRQGRALVAWETAPWIAVSVVAGAVLAWALPAVVLASVDLTPLTEGSAQPPARYDPAVLAGLGGGLVLVALVAAALVAVLSGRDVAARLRAGEDR